MMKQPTPEESRKFAVTVVKRLHDAGFEALWAGGCVRDRLLGRTPKDYDVATNATPEEVRNVFGYRHTLPIGAAFGVIAVKGGRSGLIEVTTFRKDAAYSDGRRPDHVEFSSAEEDAQRRDFTINGLFYDPLADEVLDYVGGQADLEAKRLRAIGDARERFTEDKLRLLRAIRFTATYGFSMDQETFTAVKAMGSEILVVSAERIAAEMRRMLVHENRADAVHLLRVTGLLHVILPESEDEPVGEELDETRLLQELREPTFPTALAALLERHVDRRLDDHSLQKWVEHIGRRWRLSNDEIQAVAWLVLNAPNLRRAADLPWPRVQRVLIDKHAGAGVDLADAIEKAVSGNSRGVEFCRERLAWPTEQLNPAPLLDGDVLRQAGLRPGPDFRVLIERTRDAQLDQQIKSEDEALAFARRLLGELNDEREG